jgi:hypothetical protein
MQCLLQKQQEEKGIRKAKVPLSIDEYHRNIEPVLTANTEIKLKSCNKERKGVD